MLTSGCVSKPDDSHFVTSALVTSMFIFLCIPSTIGRESSRTPVDACMQCLLQQIVAPDDPRHHRVQAIQIYQKRDDARALACSIILIHIQIKQSKSTAQLVSLAGGQNKFY